MDDNLLAQIFEFDPEVHDILKRTSNVSKKYVGSYQPYQPLLSLNLGLPSFAKLLLHEDLKVFENLVFPKATYVKVAALIFVFKMAENILFYSPTYIPVLGAFFDEVASLAQNNSQGFDKFLILSKFVGYYDPKQPFLYFLKTKNVTGLVSLIRACPELFSDVEKLLMNTFAADFPKSLEVLSEHFSKNPSDFHVFLGRRCSEIGFMCLY